MKTTRHTAWLVTALALVGGTGCAGKGHRTIHLALGDRGGVQQYIEPNEITVTTDEWVTFEIQNVGTEHHSLYCPEAGLQVIFVPVGSTVYSDYLAPVTPGRFIVYCEIPGHREKGMEGVIKVVQGS